MPWRSARLKVLVIAILTLSAGCTAGSNSAIQERAHDTLDLTSLLSTVPDHPTYSGKIVFNNLAALRTAAGQPSVIPAEHAMEYHLDEGTAALLGESLCGSGLLPTAARAKGIGYWPLQVKAEFSVGSDPHELSVCQVSSNPSAAERSLEGIARQTTLGGLRSFQLGQENGGDPDLRRATSNVTELVLNPDDGLVTTVGKAGNRSDAAYVAERETRVPSLSDNPNVKAVLDFLKDSDSIIMGTSILGAPHISRLSPPHVQPQETTYDIASLPRAQYAGVGYTAHNPSEFPLRTVVIYQNSLAAEQVSAFARELIQGGTRLGGSTYDDEFTLGNVRTINNILIAELKPSHSFVGRDIMVQRTLPLLWSEPVTL